MAIDFGTLIRAGGEGLIGHRQGQLAREEQDREDARQASTEKTAQLRREREMMEIEALRNPAPETPRFGVGASGRPTISGATDPGRIEEFLQQFPPTASDEPTLQRFDTSEGMSTFDPSTGAATPLIGPGGDRLRGISRTQDDEAVEANRVSAARADVSDALTAVSRIFNPSNQQFSTLSDFERAQRADREARNRGFDGMPDLIARAAEIQKPPTTDGGERSAQELWDAAAAELGSPEAATAQLGPRPAG